MPKANLKSISSAVALIFLTYAISNLSLMVYRGLDLSVDVDLYQFTTELLELALVLALTYKFSNIKSEFKAFKSVTFVEFSWYICAFLSTLTLASAASGLGTRVFQHYFPISSVDLSEINPTNPIYASITLISFVLVVIIGPITEELVFRQLLHRVWIKLIGPIATIILLNLAFTLLHFPYPLSSIVALCKFLLIEAPSVFVAGMAYGLVRIKLSLMHAILLHCAYNLVVFAARPDLQFQLKIVGLFTLPILIALTIYMRKKPSTMS